MSLTNGAAVLSVRNVKKRIGKRLIIKGVSFEIGEGEIFGFLGPNGSGKTTTIRMLVGLIAPTEGSIRICGYDIRTDHNEALRLVGCIVENPELYSYMTGWDNLDHFARMLPGVDEARIHEVVELVGLDQRIHDKVRTYSLGMRQRLGIAQAMLGRPKLLILDEPTNGLDPQGIKEMRAFIRKLADEGLSVFVSSHLLSEIQLMCDRVAIISHGEVLAVGEVDELLREAGERIAWQVEPRVLALQVFLGESQTVQLLDEAEAEPDVAAITADPHHADAELLTSTRLIMTRMEPEHIPALTGKLVAAGVRVYGIQHRNPTLEELFLSMTEGETID
ncbi:ABC transporter ATP-binding protein [Paenibacillus koleovorans]|uniref:ABC transporter ATP-binding protein n=1 Tax=Paenibacillus koleovorans TaxID=121608 RepID=UPI000FDBAD22|nr:ABC transporter ATP-binding protein [Paenibacillus koleovorans]